MTKGEAYSKGIRKDQVTGSYGDFDPTLVASSGGRYPVDVLYFKTAEAEGPVVHPTQKPVSLGRYLIRTFTNPGDTVLDNTSGSGSFLISALLEGRNFVGIEKNEDVALFKRKPVDYIEITKSRVSQTLKKMLNSELFIRGLISAYRTILDQFSCCYGVVKPRCTVFAKGYQIMGLDKFLILNFEHTCPLAEPTFFDLLHQFSPTVALGFELTVDKTNPDRRGGGLILDKVAGRWSPAYPLL